MKLGSLFIVAACLTQAEAYPASLGCNPENWNGNVNTGNMGVTSFTSATGEQCKITVPDTVELCTEFEVTASTNAFAGAKHGFKFSWTKPGDGAVCANVYENTIEAGPATISVESGEATGDITVYAVCGGKSGLFVSTKTVNVNGGSCGSTPPTPSGDSTPPTPSGEPEEDLSPTTAPTQGAQVVDSINGTSAPTTISAGDPNAAPGILFTFGLGLLGVGVALFV